MSDVASLRAEIKHWERSFKAANGREPTIDDIKKQPVVAQKYKSYKKLSKAATAPVASSSLLTQNDPPSTPIRPTRSSQSSKLLQSASRIIETTAPLASFNPFSPQKNKGKQKEIISSNAHKQISNPFASPRKSKSQKSHRQLSADPFPPIDSSQSSTSNHLLPEPPSPVSRARKRLRGEPVSPSPNKEKRRRVLPQTSLPFPKLELQGVGSDSDNDEEADRDNKMDEGHSSFVDDSPMKPTVNGKQFTLLFEETVKPTSMTDLFGSGIFATNSPPSNKDSSKNSLPSMDEEISSADSKPSHKPSKNALPSKSRPSAPAKLRSKLVQMTLPMVNKASNGFRKETPLDGHTSAKRPLPDVDSTRCDGHDEPDSTADSPNVIPQLLPPSPNSIASRTSGRSNISGARSHQPPKNANRKKARLQRGDRRAEDTNDDDGSSSDGLDFQQSVKLVHHSRGILAAAPTEGGDPEIEDPILNYARRVLPRGEGSVSPAKQVVHNPFGHGADEVGGEGDADGEERMDGNLPDELHRVLVLESLKSKRNVLEEEKLVKQLLSGRRIIQYDPRKGGEIWGVGEDDKNEFVEAGGTEIDERGDEWEGEPVPWEVGELSESHYYLEEL